MNGRVPGGVLLAGFGLLACTSSVDPAPDAAAEFPPPAVQSVPAAVPFESSEQAAVDVPPVPSSTSQDLGSADLYPSPNPRAAPVVLEPFENHHRVRLPARLDDHTATPYGVALIKWSELWNVNVEKGEVEMIALGTDLHGVASDQRSLYWLGRFDNGQYSYRSRETKSLRSFAPLGQQHGLAVGDAPYGVAEKGAVWRIGKRHLSLVHGPHWHGRGSAWIVAGDGVVVTQVFDSETLTWHLWRVVGRKAEKLGFKAPCIECADLDMEGRLVLVQEGKIQLLGLRAKAPRTLFESADTSAICWCGRDICTLSKDAGEIRRHRRLSEQYTVIAADVGPTRRISCSSKYVSWAYRDGEEDVVHVASLDLGRMKK